LNTRKQKTVIKIDPKLREKVLPGSRLLRISKLADVVVSQSLLNADVVLK
jgi:hypothetical protein